jgi:drug/metabolite transporter superfamily protein YnfA
MLLTTLILAAMLEIGGLAAIRLGFVRQAWLWAGLGAVTLLAYGVVVNLNRGLAFGRLMGLYITVFFAMSQVLSLVVFGERPSAGLVIGGSLIAVGGLVIQLAK